MAIRPHHLLVLAVALIGLGTVGLAAYRYLGQHRPEARSIPERQVFDRTALHAELDDAGFRLGAPAHVRIFKREKRLELWLARDDGRYARFKDYDICTYSGDLGPKLREGDRQAPEGFYRVGLKQLNPGSRHHLSFNLGFPNALDTQLGRTGSALMVHGGCSSVGCYAITDESVDEVYAVVEAALKQGQEAVDVAVFPFRMTATALADEGSSQWLGFWRNLKQGYDLFEADLSPPQVAACRGEYRFGPAAEDAQCARYRRLVLIDRVIPFLAAFVGLIALAGAVTAQLSSVARTQSVIGEIASVRAAIDSLAKGTAVLPAPSADDGTAEGLLALQDRMNKLERDWQAQKELAASLPMAPAAGDLGAPSADQPVEAAAIDPNLPTTDCIPLGTRFMVTPNETYPLCQSKQKVQVGMITADAVEVIGAGTVVETGFGALAGSNCTVMVFSADAAGFAEVRVTCT